MRGPRHRPRQRSPFLDLPFEIRSQIYKIALVSPFPIDLSPTDYITTPEEFARDPETQRRYEAYKPDTTKLRARMRHLYSGVKLVFRIQSDLLYVRKHLATGLLGTCTQIYREAADYFWCSNLWRFSGDQNWVTLYRFLLTIGPAARSRIKRLDVVATHARPISPPFASYVQWQMKNHPKLHMTKIWYYDCCDYLRDCTDPVYAMLMREKSLGELNFLVPSGYQFQFPEWMEETPQLGFSPRVSLVVEAGGIILASDEDLVAGWDILVLPGSDVGDIMDNRSQFWTKTPGKEQLWKCNLDYLTGVSHLFENEEVSIHANGGRTHIPGKGQKVERSLQAFGPCMIVVEDVDCDCWKCRPPWYYRTHEPIGTRYRSLVDVRDDVLLDWTLGFDLWGPGD